jgi:hypothetical protein
VRIIADRIKGKSDNPKAYLMSGGRVLSQDSFLKSKSMARLESDSFSLSRVAAASLELALTDMRAGPSKTSLFRSPCLDQGDGIRCFLNLLAEIHTAELLQQAHLDGDWKSHLV